MHSMNLWENSNAKSSNACGMGMGSDFKKFNLSAHAYRGQNVHAHAQANTGAYIAFAST